MPSLDQLFIRALGAASKTPTYKRFVIVHGKAPKRPFTIESKYESLYRTTATIAMAKEYARKASIESGRKMKIFDSQDRWIADADGGQIIY